MKTRSRILGTGSYLPPRVVKNDDLKQYMDTSDEWIQQRTGIKQRYWVDKKETTTSDLALMASEKAIADAKIDKKEIDLIILATLSPDNEFPGTACALQDKLGVPEIPALDVRQQCSGFIYGVSIADQFIRTGMYKKVLVVGAEVHSKGLDLSDHGRDVSVLFGDAASAAVLGACEVKDDQKDSYIYSTHLHADGKYRKELWLPGLGMDFEYGARFHPKMVEDRDIFPKMNGKTVFVHASKRMPEAVLEALAANGKKIEEVDLFIFHQANLRINEMVAKQLGIPADKCFNTIDRFANTTAATIPLGMDTAVREGKLKRGMLVCSATFGSGFTWGSMLMRW
ncbi:MAG: 3-oxoacyl-ACP synthase III family protein [Bacteriovoracia bacterium]